MERLGDLLLQAPFSIQSEHRKVKVKNLTRHRFRYFFSLARCTYMSGRSLKMLHRGGRFICQMSFVLRRIDR